MVDGIILAIVLINIFSSEKNQNDNSSGYTFHFSQFVYSCIRNSISTQNCPLKHFLPSERSTKGVGEPSTLAFVTILVTTHV